MTVRLTRSLWIFVGSLFLMTQLTAPGLGDELGEHGFADSDGVKIHYVTAGEGPLVVMIHGFPDYWYTWREQIPTLAKSFKVVAVDQRGYNKSDQPDGVDNYAMPKLVGDIAAVIRHFERDKVVVVGHDWGGMVAWSFALMHPELTDQLVILNLPHPNGLSRELANNPKQQEASAYARFFQQPNAASTLNADGLATMVAGNDVRAKERYVEALGRSSIEGMLNYYKANYPREPYQEKKISQKVACPVLVIHGLKDVALLSSGLNNTWEWVEKDLTLVTLPNAGHWVQRDQSETVTRTIDQWLRRED